jgi:hypothetical protein
MIVSSFIIQANVIMIVNYDRQTFIVQATGLKPAWVKITSMTKKKRALKSFITLTPGRFNLLAGFRILGGENPAPGFSFQFSLAHGSVVVSRSLCCSKDDVQVLAVLC